MFYFYKTTNLINNKYYYGSGHMDDYYGSGKTLQKALNKYGKENFKVEKLRFFNTRKAAYNFEDRFLKIHKPANNTECYNIVNAARGGDTFTNHPNKKAILEKRKQTKIKNGTVGWPHESRLAAEKQKQLYHPGYGSLIPGEVKDMYNKKHSDTMKGWHKNNDFTWVGCKHTEESKMKMSAALSGENHPNFGKPLPEETKIKISKATKGKTVSVETRRKISKAAKGKTVSAETKKKQSQAALNRYKIEIDQNIKDKINDLYVNEIKSIKYIAEQVKLSKSKVKTVLGECGIVISKYRRFKNK